jgi:hypothetical protein
MRVSAPDGLFQPYRVDGLGDAGSGERKDALRALLRGTGWERFLK